MTFNLIPRDEIEIDQPTFKASIWKSNDATGTFANTEFCECYTLVDGRWEGFVSVRARRPSRDKRKTLPRLLTDLLGPRVRERVRS